MIKKEIEQFETDIANISNDKMNPFVEIYYILKGLVMQNHKVLSQEFMNKLSNECEDVKELQNFIGKYMLFHNKLVLEFENLETLSQEQFHKEIELLADTIFSTVPNGVKKQNLFGAIEDIVVTIIEEYNINLKYITNEQQFSKILSKAFNNNDMMIDVFKSFLGMHASYLQNEDIEYSLEELIEFHRMLIVFIFVGNIHRKQELNTDIKTSSSANNSSYKVSRNDRCPCGSGKKFKKCCLNKKEEADVYQLKISIKGAKPPIWRRILLKSDITFEELHNIIQAIFNWEDYHMYQFDRYKSYTNKEFMQEDMGYGDKLYDASNFKISDELHSEKDKLKYTYDFGDDWEHEILLEKILQPDNKIQYPICTAGKRNGPIEDCGGICGYSDIVYMIENQDFSEAEYFMDDDGQYYYDDFDPAYFNKDEINKRLKQVYYE